MKRVFSDDADMMVLVDWASRRQVATARSTGEAEVVAGADCLQSTAPLAAVLERFFQQLIPYQLRTDSDAARNAILNGYSRKLRYMTKNQGICLSFVSHGLTHIGGDIFPADLHSKPLLRVAFQKFRTSKGIVDISPFTT